MKKKLLILLLSILAIALCVTACSKKDTEAAPVSIEVISSTVPTECAIGATLDFSTIKVNVHFDDGSITTVGFSDVTVGSIDTSTAGEKTVTVTYGSLSTTFTVTVKENASDVVVVITGIKIVPGSAPTSALLKKPYDTSTLQVEAIYSDGTKKMIPIEEVSVSSIDTSTAGEKTLTVSYLSFTDSMTVTVLNMTEVYVKSGTLVDKLFVGETLDTSNVVLFVKYADGNLVEVSAQDLAIDASKVDTSKAGKYKLAITYNGFTLNCEIEVVGIDSLKVRGGSVDKTVFVNGILDTSNLEAFLYYTDGEKFLITNDQLEITNINTSIVGVQQLKIAYKFVGTNIETTVETTYDIEVIGVKDIKIIDGTIKNEILKGKETFDPSNIKVSVTYTNDTHENKAFADLTLSAIDSTKAGEQKLTISYLDKSIEHTVKVCTVSSIRVEGVSKTIQAGGTVDLSNIKVYGVYDDSKETEIELKTGIDTDLVDLENGDKELTVSYDGEWGVFSTMIKISSQAPELTGITVTNYDKYVVIGGAYNKESVVVYASYSNDTKEKITGATISDVVTTTAGEVTIKVTYTEEDITKEAEVTVAVLPVTKLSISGLAQRIFKGEALDTSNIAIIATFSNGEYSVTQEINASDVEISTLDTTTSGEKEFTVSYLGYTETVKVTVSEIETITVLDGTIKNEILKGESLDLSDIKVEVQYTDGIAEIKTYADLDITSTETEDTKTLVIDYKGVSIDYIVKICTVTSIRVEGINTVVQAGETVKLDGMKVYGIYNDSAATEVELTTGVSTNVNDIDWNSEANKTLVVTYNGEWGEFSANVNISATAPALESIEITAYDKYVILNGDYNEGSIKVTATYKNGNKKQITATIADVVTTAAGNVTVTATYTEGDITVDDEVTVAVLPVTKLNVSGLAQRIFKGEALDTSNIAIIATFSNGEYSVTQEINASDVEISTLDTTTSGEKEFTVSYLGYTETVKITVYEVYSITVLGGTIANEILIGNDLVTSGIKVTVKYTDGMEETKTASDLTLVDIDKNTAGEQQLSITYREKTVEYTVKVCTITAIRVEVVNDVLTSGDKLNLNEVKVYGIYNDSAATEVVLAKDDYSTNFDDIDWNAEEDKNFVVTYGELTDSVTISVTAPDLTGIEITAYDKYVILNGDYNEGSVKVTATYSNGNKKQITATIADVVTTAAGDVTLTATFEEQTATATVAVLPVTKLNVSGVAQRIFKGTALDTSNMEIVAIFSNDEYTVTKEIKVSDAEVVLDTTAASEKDIEVSYLGYTEKVKITVYDVESITVLGGTIANEILKGENLDTSSIKVTVKYTDNEEETKTASDLTLGSIDKNTAGEQQLSITYLETTINHTVKVCTITAIRVEGIDKEVQSGNVLDISNMTVYGIYNDSAATEVELTTGVSTNVDDIDWKSEDNQTLVVTYNGEWGKFSETVYITVTPPDLVSIEFTAYDKYVILNGDYNEGSVKVSARYSNDSIKPIDVQIADVVTTVAGNVTITATYMDKEATATVAVLPVTKLNVSGVAQRIFKGTALDMSNIAITATFSNGEYSVTNIINTSDANVATFDNETIGANDLKVSYLGYTETVKITVYDVESITVLNGTVKNEIFKGDVLDASGIKVEIKYTDSITETKSYNDLTLGAIDNNTAGEQQLSITYLGETVKYTVKVCTIVDIRVTGVNKVVPTGQPIDISGMKVYGIFDDSAETEIELTSGITTNKAELDAIQSQTTKTFTVTYTDAKWGTFIKNITIYASAPSVESITITNFDKFVGIYGVYNKDSVVVYANYSNGESEKVTDVEISDITTTTAGKVTLTVTYRTINGIVSTTEEVTVLPITSIVVSGGVNPSVDAGGSLNTDNIEVTVTYSDGTNTINSIVTRADGVTVTDGGNSTINVTYKDVSTTYTYQVKTVDSIEIFNGYPTFLLQGQDMNLNNLTIKVTYNNGDEELVKVSSLGGKATVTKGADSFTVTYEGKSSSKTLNLVTIKSVNALNGTVPAMILQGSNLNVNSMKLTVIGSDNKAYLIGTDDPNLEITSEVNTSVPGEYSVKFKYHGVPTDPATGINIGETSVIVIVRGVDVIEVVEGTVLPFVNKGRPLDTSGLQIRIVYSDGLYTYVKAGEANLKIGTIDTSSAGKKELKITYLGKDIYYTIEVIDKSGEIGLIFGALLPDELVARESYKKNFKQQGNDYLVGDDNPFYFYLNVITLDANDNIIDIDGKTIPTASTIYMDGSTTPLTGADLTKYVEFVSDKNSYDFTEAAIGHTFRIVICPADSNSYFDAEAVTKEHTVKIVDGYNVYNAWELNLMTNAHRDLDGGDNETYLYQDELVREFLLSKGLVTSAEYINGLNALVIHGNLDVTTNDIPAKYLCSYVKDGVPQSNFYDHMGIFSRTLRTSNGTDDFSIYGNYFSIYSYNLPGVSHNGYGYNDDEYSTLSFIKMVSDESSTIFNKYHATKKDDVNFDPFAEEYKANIQDVALRDNDPNSNDQSASERHIRGSAAIFVGYCEANITNVNVDAYMISVQDEGCNTTINLTSVKLYNSWQSHLFLWATNYYQVDMGYKNDPTWNYVSSVKVNIHDSSLTKCGGPVILAQNDHREYICNNDIGNDVVVTGDSELHTYVTGQEAWFVAMGQTSLASQIMALNQLISGGMGASYSSDQFIKGVNTANMVMVNMGTDPTAILAGTYEYSGSYTENGVVALDMKDDNNTRKPDSVRTQMYDAYKVATGKKAPIFQTTAGATAYTDGATGCYGIDFTTGATGAPQATFYQGKYITVYYSGIGIMLEYYNDTNPAIPK